MFKTKYKILFYPKMLENDFDKLVNKNSPSFDQEIYDFITNKCGSIYKYKKKFGFDGKGKYFIFPNDEKQKYYKGLK